MLTRISSLFPRLRSRLLFQTKTYSVVSSSIPVSSLRPHVRKFIEDSAQLCQPDEIHVCSGSEEENKAIIDLQISKGRLIKLTKLDNCYLARTAPEDVARVESKTYICTDNERETRAIPKDGVKSILANWRDQKEMRKEISEKMNGCMKGRTMYVIPYSMGPVGSPLSKIGVQVTDSEYVVSSMNIMTRVGERVLEALNDGEFVKCVHSVGHPLQPGAKDVNWPCNPKNLFISHFPAQDEIVSFGSGYGGNSLLGKKCFALRIASILAKREGWLAEHMLILGITNPKGEKKYIAAAFPSQCGKTNLAMMLPSLPGWKIECVGDDIGWMRFDETGQLRAINPENGLFGVAPGTNHATNPNAMACFTKNSVFTNVAHTSDGGVYWEGLEDEVDLTGLNVTNWRGHESWTREKAKELGPASHPNARFCSPASQCPVIDPLWEDPKGVPISAIIFGGRRPSTIPLVFETLSWSHGVFIGSGMRSEATSAAEHSGKAIMHDPFAMRPFFSYNFGEYLNHWLSLQDKPEHKLPKVFHVNWFRKDENNKFMWPGFGENSRVLEWIFNRCNGEDIANPSPIGLIPKPGSINTEGLDRSIDAVMPKLFEASKQELEAEADAIQKFYSEQLPNDVPERISKELEDFRKRISAMD